MSGICGILSYFERNSAKPPVCSGCPLAIIGSALCHTRTVPGPVSDQCQANIRQMQNAETAWRQFTIIILQKHAELYISGYTFSVWIVYVLCIGFVCSLGPPGLAPAWQSRTFFSHPKKRWNFNLPFFYIVKICLYSSIYTRNSAVLPGFCRILPQFSQTVFPRSETLGAQGLVIRAG